MFALKSIIALTGFEKFAGLTDWLELHQDWNLVTEDIQKILK